MLLLLVLSVTIQSIAQGPEVTSWYINTTGQVGYLGILSNVQTVQYTTTDVYVSCTCIPGYDIGPWAGNPNTPSNQNFCYKITRNPAENTGTKTATALGHIGVWSNGVSIFNAKDAFSYNSQGIWNQDAIPNEGASFDDCLGHPAPNGEYHHHVNPTCLYDDMDSSQHSIIIGYAFDGFPIYGAYGYANSDGTGGIKRMETSYSLRNITTRTTLPDGTVLNASEYGPAVSGTYPLGKYIEDYEFISASGDLDEYNGRFCVTPDYPAGIYAYFVTIDGNLDPVYPYTLGPSYYGTVQTGNTGPGSGHNTVPGSAVTYTPATSVESYLNNENISLFPNPSSGFFRIELFNVQENFSVKMYDVNGKLVFEKTNNSTITDIDATGFANGMYFVTILTDSGIQFLKKVVKN